MFFLKSNQNFSTLEMVKTYNIKFGKYIYRKKYTTEDIIQKLKSYGIGTGSNIFVHSTWNAFYNYKGEPEDLIKGLINLIGPTGTIAMPAFPLSKLIKKKPFSVKRTVTGAGIIAETFRHTTGVLRSASVEHSVCALGPLAEYLTKDHCNSKCRFDELSPYYRITQCGFKIVALGLTNYYGSTTSHCVQYVLRNEIPYYAQLYDESQYVKFPYIDIDGELKYNNVVKQVKTVKSDWLRTRHIIKKYFSKDYYHTGHVSNLTVCAYDANYLYNRFAELAKKGIYQYWVIDIK